MSKRICTLHGIWNKTDKVQRCPLCMKARNKEYDKNQRDKSKDKFYHSKSWKNVRNLVLTKNPFCVECGNPADTVDHIKAINDGGAKLDIDNLQPMCKSCHNIKESKEGNRF